MKDQILGLIFGKVRIDTAEHPCYLGVLSVIIYLL